MEAAEVLHALRRLEWELYETIKPGVVTAEAMKELMETLQNVAYELTEAARLLGGRASTMLPPEPEGIHKTYEVTVSGETVEKVVFEKPVMACVIFNDGPQAVLPMVNGPFPPENRVAYLEPGECLEFRSDWPKIVDIHFVCKAGETANVRVHSWR